MFPYYTSRILILETCWWLVENNLSGLLLPFCSKMLGRWQGPMNDILSVCECSLGS